MNIKSYRPNFTFVIPTLTNSEGLLNVLKKIDTLYPDASCVVVNNNKYRLNLNKYNFSLDVVDQGKNTGFAKACNDGAKKAKETFKPKYTVFLNDDVEFSNDWVSKCLKKMENKGWFACSPILKKNPREIENAGYRVLPWGKVALNKDAGKTQKIDGLSATALIVRSDDFLQLGGFDERFFAYLEDVDLFLRVKKRNLKFGVAKNISVYHRGQTTSSKFKTKKALLDFKNWIFVILKNWSRDDLKKYWFQILVERGRNFFGIVKSLF